MDKPFFYTMSTSLLHWKSLTLNSFLTTSVSACFIMLLLNSNVSNAPKFVSFKGLVIFPPNRSPLHTPTHTFLWGNDLVLNRCWCLSKLYFFPVDGSYSEWTEFGKCTVTCGGGVRQRTRECTNPAPDNGGQSCERLGPAMESEQCNVEPCPTKAAENQG